MYGRLTDEEVNTAWGCFPPAPFHTLGTGYFARRPRLSVDAHRWTDAQFTAVKHFFDTLDKLKENPMLRVFTLELRVDYRDKEKLELVRTIMAQAAREVYGSAALLNDHIKPQVAIFSDDFFQTHEELALMHGAEDTPKRVETFPRVVGVPLPGPVAVPSVENKLTPHQYTGAAAPSTQTVEASEDISPELLAALKG